jgi:hypothetical protein
VARLQALRYAADTPIRGERVRRLARTILKFPTSAPKGVFRRLLIPGLKSGVYLAAAPKCATYCNNIFPSPETLKKNSCLSNQL